MNGGPGGLFAQLAQGFQGGYGPGHRAANPSAYDEYLKAYSVAMLPGRERENVSYGGKIIMPPSALAHLTSLDLDSPWMFKLRNPANPAASTHAGVLEFIAEEGVVHLPYWMMKTLRLNEGDPIRITGTEVPKGKFVKLQAQHVHFLEISDPKAVLEQALRNFTCLTQGDIIEISYNSIVFGLLVMEASPGGEGISVLDTDLEVDFAAPVGYVEPERPKPPPPSTMATKLNIDVTSSTPGSSRPGSSIGGTFAGTSKAATNVSKGGNDWETFKGKGETLGGRRTKGRGITHRQAEAVPTGSKIIRTDQHRVVSNDDIESEDKVPAPLNLPLGKLFFGFNIPDYVPPPPQPDENAAPQSPPSFAGSGNTLSGRPSSGPQSKGKGKAKEEDNAKQQQATWGQGQGQTLGARSSAPPARNIGNGQVGAGGAAVPRLPQRSSQKKKERSPSPEMDWGVDDDEPIDIDSD
ncbi:ubiquitin fusion degradation protein I [Stereum hirsutum FP-91666 SS1]|uniref:ubiquitin fusion degradation protein I n=1 Tax=Stereum hirsutum (strain FP-91666) TaxID=721885 RepID=UPI0004410724|nr:ubiquitin fusion degradation protein I [Stereum hirsutum FP-91666 SS1]EIM89844.1 ubiquitin fusion degradation protein I [Stereum hirsutum FP-91666 SS1]